MNIMSKIKEIKNKLEVELDELDTKIFNLEKFLSGDYLNTLPQIQISLLIIQRDAMVTYRTCLDQRINTL